MGIDEQYTKQLQGYLIRCQKTKQYPKVIQQLLKSPNYESWQILDEILKKIEAEDHLYFKQLIDHIEKNINSICTFLMLMFLFWFKTNRRLISFGISKWRTIYKTNCIENQQITVYSTWIASQPESRVVQQSLQMVISIFPIFINKQYIVFSQIELNAAIEWVCYCNTQSDHIYENIHKLVNLARESNIKISANFIQKQQMIVKKLMDVCCQSSQMSANAFLFIYPFNLNEKDVSYFCHLYSDFLLDLSEQAICNFFICITKSSISSQIIHLINKISLLHKNQQQFYKLRVIYQQFILPYLARRTKSCAKVHKQVYQTCQFFVLGFLTHCNIGINGIDCLVKNISKIRNIKLQQKWITLCSIVCSQNPDLKMQAQMLLSKQFKKSMTIIVDDYQFIMNSPEFVWDITVRNGRKLKKYMKFQSKIKGIVNEQNQCYIITIVQALHKCQLFLAFLQRNIKQIKKSKLLNQIEILFEEISGRRKVNKITVRYLKNYGPKQFRDSLSQQDAFQYLIQLLQAIQIELKQWPQLLKDFKDIFEIKSVATNVCSKCKKESETIERAYALTIPNNQILKQETVQNLNDFNCQKCGSGQTKLIRKLEPTSQILIVHINRFSCHNDILKKQLSSQVILRYFFDYMLVGMVCHRGKNMEHGHYVYYHRIHDKRWASINDLITQQFELQTENEQFEREWKLEVTPYILFYQRIKQ